MNQPAVSSTPSGALAASGLPAPSLPDYIDYAHYREAEGYRLLQHCLSAPHDAESVLRTLEHAGLLDFAGEVAPAASKWRAARALPGPRRAVVRIGDGRPDDFRDRMLLERDPHRLLEGLLIACWAAGIDEAFLQLDDKHQACREMLLLELETLAQELPITGLTPIRLCSAVPGTWATLVNEVETLYWVRELSEKGGDGLTDFGHPGYPGYRGLRWYAVSGRVREPGLKLAPAGSTAQELIEEHAGGMAAGQRLYACVCGGGAAGRILPASQARTALDAGGVTVLSDRDSVVDAARSLLRSFVRDACGHDEGVRAAAGRFAALVEQPRWTAALLVELRQLVREHSSAGAFVRMAENTIDSLSSHFEPEMQ